jgi:glycosyltransferase involved in cell wall biosynthesis
LIACNDLSGKWGGIDAFCVDPNDMRSRVMRHLFGDLLATVLLERAISQHRIRYILINYATLALKTRRAWEKLDVKVFVHCHGIDIHVDAKAEQWPHHNIYPRCYMEQLRQLSDRVIYIANSHHTRNCLTNIGIPQSRIEVKMFGVEEHGEMTGSVRRKGKPLVLLFLGRLVDFKGPDLVIKAFELARRKGLLAELIIAGDGPLMPTCELLRDGSPFRDEIRILGPVDRRTSQELYQQADIFVCHHRKGPLSNREEAFGVTMIEAMSYGLPIITGKSGGIVESVIHGQTGFLVAPGDVDAYVEHLMLLGADSAERERIGRNGVLHVQENFSLVKEKECLLKFLS